MTWEIRQGDALERLREMPDESVQCCVTSPPYWGLRDYGIPPTDWPALTYALPGGEIAVDAMSCCFGLEETPELFVGHLVLIMREVERVLRKDGVLWLNLGDSYADGGCGPRDPERWPKQSRNDHMPTHAKRGHGLKNKDLVGVPWLSAFALRTDGWYLRRDIIWSKPNPMPESVTDRPTTAHEYVFLLSKSPRYFYDAAAIREEAVWAGQNRSERPPVQLQMPDAPAHKGLRQEKQQALGRNKRSVWTIATRPFTGWGLADRRVPVSRGDADGDTKRTTSPDCPEHGDHPAPAAKGRRDAREADRSNCTLGNDGHRAEAQPGEPAPTGPNPSPDFGDENSDSHVPASLAPASGHSTRSRKTAPSPETSPAYRPSAGTSSHTPDTSDQLGSSEPRPGKTDRNSGGGDSGDLPESQTSDCTARTSSSSALPACTCEFYRVDRIDHFATFPPDLVEPCILAGSPERACGECGAPWQREVEVSYENPGNRKTNGPRSTERKHAEFGSAGFEQRLEKKTRTVGFKPVCEHDDASGRALVLDPFAGAATTGLVAARLNRDFIGIELNPEYVELGRHRIRDDAPLLNHPAELVGATEISGGAPR